MCFSWFFRVAGKISQSGQSVRKLTAVAAKVNAQRAGLRC
jgi:hypothetical protein